MAWVCLRLMQEHGVQVGAQPVLVHADGGREQLVHGEGTPGQVGEGPGVRSG